MPDATYQTLFGTDLLLWADATNSSGMFTDTGGTTPASNGSEVRRLNQSTGASLTTAWTGTNGPTYRSNYASSGYPALEFDGVNDRLGVVGGGLTASDFMVLCCFTRISGTASTVWFRGTTIANIVRQLYTGDAGHQLQWGIASSYSSATISPTVTGRNVWATAAKTGQVELNTLGPSTGAKSTPYGGSLGDGFYLGAGENSGVYQPANIALNELLVIGSNCEWGNVIRAAKLMRTKWGLTDPNATPQYSNPGGSLINSQQLVRAGWLS